MHTTFVTGAAGLLGNNLVRLLLSGGERVKARARSTEKAEKKFGALPARVVAEDMTKVGDFAGQLAGTITRYREDGWLRREPKKTGALRARGESSC